MAPGPRYVVEPGRETVGVDGGSQQVRGRDIIIAALYVSDAAAWRRDYTEYRQRRANDSGTTDRQDHPA